MFGKKKKVSKKDQEIAKARAAKKDNKPKIKLKVDKPSASYVKGVGFTMSNYSGKSARENHDHWYQEED